MHRTVDRGLDHIKKTIGTWARLAEKIVTTCFGGPMVKHARAAAFGAGGESGGDDSSLNLASRVLTLYC